MRTAISTVTGHPRWHAYQRDERHAPWKFLLPVTPGTPVLAVGLKGSELASLSRSWDRVRVYRSDEGEIEWAREQAHSLGQECHLEKISSLRTGSSGYRAIAVRAESSGEWNPSTAFRLLEPGGAVAWIGRRRDVPSKTTFLRQGFHALRAYAPVTSRSGNIIFIPLVDNRCTLAGLSLFNPTKRHNRWALRVFRLASRAGARRFLSSDHLVVSRKPGQIDGEEYLTEWIGRHLARQVTDVSVYTGWTKLIIQLLDRHGGIIGFARIADTPFGNISIERERAALKSLERVPEMEKYIPKVLLTGDWNGHPIQVQTAPEVGRRSYAGKLTAAHLTFLTLMSRVDRRETPLERWPHWERVWRWAHESTFDSREEAGAVRDAVNRIAKELGNKNIPLHRIHGDFTPMHALLGHSGLVVVDWEGSESDGLPLFDAAHFSLAQHQYKGGVQKSLRQLMVSSRFGLNISPEVRDFAASLRLDPEVIRLANLYAYMIFTNPLMRFERWN